ncbi:hypothetical protein ACFL23_02860 [Patescibacteria group bacterium]
MKKLVVCVCHGNIHRSVIAEHCFNLVFRQRGLDKELFAISRGIQGTMNTDLPKYANLYNYEKELTYSEPFLKQIGVCIPQKQMARPITATILGQASIVLAMDHKVLIAEKNNLVRQFPEYGYKMRLFLELAGSFDDVIDCCGSDDIKLYQQTIMMINTIATKRIDMLRGLIKVFNLLTEKGGNKK